ncbi:MAG: hypothetical protein RLZ31_799, partial [Pseudomonadota bacterium]
MYFSYLGAHLALEKASISRVKLFYQKVLNYLLSHI